MKTHRISSTKKINNTLSLIGSLLLFAPAHVIIGGLISLALLEHAGEWVALPSNKYFLAGFLAVPFAILLSCTPIITRCFSGQVAAFTPGWSAPRRAALLRVTVMCLAAGFALINAWQYAP